MADPVIWAKDLNKSYGEFKALQEVSLEVQKGECYGLLGPNGAGKSTLISLLYGLRTRTSGTLKVFGLDPESHGKAIKKRLGVVTQENALDESLTVEENMLIYAAFIGVEKSVRKARVEELLCYMQLERKMNQRIRTLSGGMKRRLVFVRALLGNPDLIILDEPTTGLDPAVRHLLWGKIKSLKEEGKTILLTTHYMHEAEILCSKVLVLNQGKTVTLGTPQALIHQHTPGYVAVFEKSNLKSGALAYPDRTQFHLHEDSSATYFRAASLEALMDLQVRLDRPALQLRPANLEDVFLKLTGQELATDA